VSDPPPISPAQLEKLTNGMLAAYDTATLKEMVRYKLDRQLEQEVNVNQGDRFVIADLLALADRKGWLVDLIRAARLYQPDNTFLRMAAQETGLEPRS
jgi:hypothetical protein